MKAIFTLALFLGLAATAAAQETMDQMDQQPQPVTQKQVERDARKAQEQRKLNEEAAQRANADKNKKENEKEKEQRPTPQQNTNATTNGSRASNRPEKQ